MGIASELAPGSVLCGFRIESLIGRGGMGVVYRATQLSLGRPVALKLISPELVSEERFRDRFLREARLAASIEHPHLLPVYEAGEGEGSLFCAMRLVEGPSLADVLRREGRLAPERAVRLVAQVASALQVAHDAGLLHRDVKPANILVSGSRDAEHMYVADFGLARRLSGGSLTRVGAFVGTAVYAAPEQIRGEPIDERADVYALGCVLYECLTGAPPFGAEDELALCWAHLHEPPPSLHDADPALTRFDSCFARALAKDPAQRFPSASALAEAALAGGVPSALVARSPVRLPRPLGSFLGRERELQELVEHLLSEEVRLLTLTGPGGTGKTRLALRAAEEAATAFPDGVYWVGLAPLRDPALVTETIAQTLETKAELEAHIADKNLLLLLDNLEQVIESAPALTALLQSCPNLTLLVTSRELLRVQGEVEYPVPPLAEGDATSLFCQRSQLETSREIVELCRRLDNLPLAVELAAGRTKALSPAQILERLSQRLDLLKGGRDADPRQHTLRATIEWSYDLLSREEKELFRRLSVFAGGCTLEACEEICDADLDTLQSLVAQSLLRFTSERYWMLETVREYAGERLAGSAEAHEIHRRHAMHAIERAAEPSVEHARAWMVAVERDYADFRAALNWLSGEGLADDFVRLASRMGLFWANRDYLREGRAWLERALAAGGGSGPERARARVDLARIMWEQGDLDTALADVKRAAEESRQLRDRSIQAGAAAIHGAIESTAGRLEIAKDLFRRAMSLYGEMGDERGVAWMTHNLGITALIAGDTVGARALFDDALEHSRSVSNRWLEASSLGNLGLIALEGRRIVDARDLARAALRTYADSGLFVLSTAVDLYTFAAATAVDGNVTDACLLVGAADAYLAEVGAVREPLWERARSETRQIAAARLGTEQAEAAERSGAELSLTDAVGRALK